LTRYGSVFFKGSADGLAMQVGEREGVEEGREVLRGQSACGLAAVLVAGECRCAGAERDEEEAGVCSHSRGRPAT
jgi:hypothetical protein